MEISSSIFESLLWRDLELNPGLLGFGEHSNHLVQWAGNIFIYIYIYIYIYILFVCVCVCVCLCMCVCIYMFVFSFRVVGPKKEQSKYFKMNSFTERYVFFRIISFVLTYVYVASLLFSPEQTYVTQGHINRSPNETRTNMCRFFSPVFFLLVLYGSIYRFLFCARFLTLLPSLLFSECLLIGLVLLGI